MYLSVKIKEAMKTLIDLITPKLENKPEETVETPVETKEEELKSEEVVEEKLEDSPNAFKL